jgi:hypothetical protein
MTADAGVMNMTDLKDLAPLAKRINSASDELTQTLDTIQQQLNTLALGVEVWLQSHELDHEVMERDEQQQRQTIHAAELGYGRLGDGWGVLVRRVEYTMVLDTHGEWDCQGESVELDRKLLTKASRHQRVQAVERLPTLIDLIRDEAMRVITSVDAAKKVAASLK